MAIKDKQGNVYRLRGPNTFMKTQESWDTSGVVFHNMFFPQITMPDTRRKREYEPDEFDPLPTPREEDIPMPMPVPVPSQPTPTPVVPKANKLARLIEERKIPMLYLPVVEKTVTDDLYGSTYSRTQYGQKASLYGVIVGLEDLYFTFWTETRLTPRSIVFPTKMEMKRWWRVDQCEPQSSGFLVSCSPSPVSPDFSD